MKRIVVACILLSLFVFGACPVCGAYGITTERQDWLHDTADALRAMGVSEDSEEIKSLQRLWWAEQEDLDIIAKTVMHEADPAYCEWEHSLSVAVVILNRVASPYFKGDTVKEIVAAPGQYLKAYTYGFENTTELCYLVAKAAKDGDHNVPADAFWQDTNRQGCYVWKEFLLDTGWYKSTTYICCGIPGVKS